MLRFDNFLMTLKMVTISGVQPNGQLQEIWVQFGSIQFRFN